MCIFFNMGIFNFATNGCELPYLIAPEVGVYLQLHLNRVIGVFVDIYMVYLKIAGGGGDLLLVSEFFCTGLNNQI